MKLTAGVKLVPTEAQRQPLLQTIEQTNAACNWMSQQAWDTQTFNMVRLHHLTYYPAKEHFKLTAQVVVRCIGKVVDAYKLNKKVPCHFKKLGAVVYDTRILTWYDYHVSIWTLNGREKIDFICGDQQRWMLHYQRGESDLVYRNGHFYLLATCDIPDDAPIDPEGFLGVDLGIKNIAVDSDGTIHTKNDALPMT